MFETNDDDFFFDDAPSQAAEEDSILPDDFNQEQQEEVTEVEEDTKPSTEETEPVQNQVKIPIKFNHEEREIPLEEAIPLVQKGMNYDKIQEKLNALQSDPRLSFVDEMARESGMNTEEFLQAVREQREQARLNELIQKNIPEEYAKEILENRKFRDEFQAKQKSQQEEAKKQQEYQDFVQTFPDVDPQKIPNEVWEAYQNGRPLVDAYTRYENQQLKQQLQVLKQNQTNAQRAAVGSVTQHGAQEVAPEDDFMRGFNSI